MRAIIDLLMQEETSTLANLAALGAGAAGAAFAAAALVSAQWIYRRLYVPV